MTVNFLDMLAMATDKGTRFARVGYTPKWAGDSETYLASESTGLLRVTIESGNRLTENPALTSDLLTARFRPVEIRMLPPSKFSTPMYTA